MRRLIVAFAFLTRVPMPRVAVRPGDFAAAIRLYPLVGLAIGGAVAGAGWAGGRIDPWLGALAALAVWIAITGALHIDGLGDVADGLGAAHGDRARLLAVMADPHVGSFGVTAIALQIAAKLVLLRLTIDQGAALVLVPFAARIGPMLWARMLPPLRPDGLGAEIAAGVRTRDLTGWAALLAGAAVAVPGVLAAFVLLPLFGLWARRRLGGVSGDVHGAGIELAETGLLLALLLARQL